MAEDSAGSVTRAGRGGLGTFTSVATAVFVVDQLTKWWATNALDDGHTIPLFWTLRFRLVFNTGAAFSRFDGFGPILGVLAIAIVVVLVWAGRNASDAATAAALGAIAGGALGNVVDRLVRSEGGLLGGAVVDFIDVQWFPVWNVADMGVVLGGVAMVLLSARRSR